MRSIVAPRALHQMRAGTPLRVHVFWIAALALMVWFIGTGRQSQFALLLGATWVGAILWRFPMVGVGLLIVGFAGSRETIQYLGFLPTYPGTPIGTIYPTDVVLVFTLARSLYSLVKNRVRPLFLVPMALLLAETVAANAVGMITGDVTFRSFLNGFRNHLMGYTLYFAAVGVVNSPRKMHWTIGVAAMVVLYGVMRQLAALAGLVPFVATVTTVAGRDVPYIRAGVGWLVVLISLICAAQVAHGRKLRLFLPLGVVTMGSCLLMLVRQVMIMVAIGLLVLPLPESEGRSRRWLGVAVVTVVVGLFLVGISPLIMGALGDTALTTILDRGGTLLMTSQDASLAGRLETIDGQINAWLSGPNPALGYGFSATRYDFTGDTGIWNALPIFGPLGTGAIMLLWFVVAMAAHRSYRSLAVSLEQGYVLGAFCFWIAVLVVYLMGIDFFTFPTVEIPLAILIVDRISYFVREGLVPLRQDLPQHGQEVGASATP